MKGPRLISILFFILISINLLGQEVLQNYSPELKELILEISKANIVTGSAVGFAGETPKQWSRFEKLNEITSNQELKYLTDHPNGTVRCYAFQGLCLRNDTSCFSVLKKHLNDNEYVSTFFGCIEDSEKAGDYFFNCCFFGLNENSFKLTDKQIEIVDSILIYNPNVRLYQKRVILESLEPKKKYYNRIREIVTIEENTTAVVALARFQNLQDTSLIKGFLEKDDKHQYWGIYAVREFPHKIFFDKLIDIFETDWQQTHYNYSKWRILYQALAKYPNDKTIELFERTVKKKRGFKYQTLGKYLLIAINKYPNDKFVSIRDQIKLDAYHMDAYNSEYNMEK